MGAICRQASESVTVTALSGAKFDGAWLAAMVICSPSTLQDVAVAKVSGGEVEEEAIWHVDAILASDPVKRVSSDVAVCKRVSGDERATWNVGVALASGLEKHPLVDAAASVSGIARPVFRGIAVAVSEIVLMFLT